jgi:hypothetical protein
LPKLIKKNERKKKERKIDEEVMKKKILYLNEK